MSFSKVSLNFLAVAQYILSIICKPLLYGLAVDKKSLVAKADD